MDNNDTKNEQISNPVHGVKLADILEVLVEHYGWDQLVLEINTSTVLK